MVKPLYQLRGPGPRMGGNRINDGGVSYDEGVRNTTSSSRAAQPTQDVVVSPDANPHPIDTNPGGNQPFNRPNPLPSPDLSPQPPPWHQHTCQPNNQPARPEPDTRANLPICPGIRPSPRAGDPKSPYLRYHLRTHLTAPRTNVGCNPGRKSQVEGGISRFFLVFGAPTASEPRIFFPGFDLFGFWLWFLPLNRVYFFLGLTFSGPGRGAYL